MKISFDIKVLEEQVEVVPQVAGYQALHHLKFF
mgnify:CR=1 FL=1